jgi:hypothetical protein
VNAGESASLPTSLDVEQLMQMAVDFAPVVRAVKDDANVAFPWYPYDTLGNFIHLDRLLSGPNRRLLELAGIRRIADIGGADGDLAVFLASLGAEVDLIDHGPTNHNGLAGARYLVDTFGSSVTIQDLDLDSQFTLAPHAYGLAFLLGVLYHLQNPFFVLRALSESADFLILSTRVAQIANRVRISALPVAYLLDAHECNDDATNYWIFSLPGLLRLIDRAGWDVLDVITVGCTTDSEPAAPDRDERAFCLLASRRGS